MQKKHLSLAVLLIAISIIFCGCGIKKASQPKSENNALSTQSQEQTPAQEQAQNLAQNQNQTNNQTNETVNPSGSYSINELFSMNRPMKCTWKESVAEGDVTNIILIHGKQFYQDVTMGDIGHSFTIFNGEYLYIWNDFNDMASKMKNTGATTGIKPEQEKAKSNAGLDQKKDFVCEGWVADDSVFTPPSDKNFKDVTEEMNQAVQELNNGGLEKAKQQMCDLCKKAPTQELRDKCSADSQCGQ
jgi:hypothetical protein